jgi:threonine dehydrogenase-like Zn-dependent dehydrogenase
MNNAKLAALIGVYEFEIMEFPVPKAMEGSLVIKTEAASICGSDLHSVRAGVKNPRNIGHEFTGRVVELGTRANEKIFCYGGELKVGDRIAVYPWVTCGHCGPCLEHGHGVCGICENSFIYGGGDFGADPSTGLNNFPTEPPHFKGGFGEFVHLFPGTYVWKVPDDMSPEIASLLDPTAVAVRAIEMAMTEAGVLQEGVSTTTRALVIGAGPIGVLTAMILRYMGVEQLIISDMLQKKLDNAKEISGADVALNVNGMTVDERIKKVRDLTNGGANLVINCANHPGSSIEGLQMARKLGTYIEVGNPRALEGASEISVDFHNVLFSRNVRITGLVAVYPKTFDRAFRLLKKHDQLPFEKLITHRFSNLKDLAPTMKKMTDEDYLKGVCVFDK